MAMEIQRMGAPRGIESALGKLTPSRKITDLLGLQMSAGFEVKSAKGYWYMEIPVESLYNVTDEKVQEKGLRNQLIRVMPACSIAPKGSNVLLIEPNPELAKWGNLQGSYIVTPETARHIPGFHLHLRRDLELSEISYAIRIYMYN